MVETAERTASVLRNSLDGNLGASVWNKQSYDGEKGAQVEGKMDGEIMKVLS